MQTDQLLLRVAYFDILAKQFFAYRDDVLLLVDENNLSGHKSSMKVSLEMALEKTSHCIIDACSDNFDVGKLKNMHNHNYLLLSDFFKKISGLIDENKNIDVLAIFEGMFYKIGFITSIILP